MLREMGVEMSDLMGGAGPPAEAAEAAEAETHKGAEAVPAIGTAGSGTAGSSTAGGKVGSAMALESSDVFSETAKNGGIEWQRFNGAQQLQNPATLNLKEVRHSCVP